QSLSGFRPCVVNGGASGNLQLSAAELGGLARRALAAWFSVRTAGGKLCARSALVGDATDAGRELADAISEKLHGGAVRSSCAHGVVEELRRFVEGADRGRCVHDVDRRAK